MSVYKLPDSVEFRRGNLPDNTVNIAYLATKEITPEDVVVQNISGGTINSSTDGVYLAGYNGRLEQGPEINDKNVYVTDLFKDGNLDKPLYFVGKSRYYHLCTPIYSTGDKYTGGGVSIYEKDGSKFNGSYVIYVELHSLFETADGLPDTHSDEEIPYRLIIHTDVDRPLTIKYNKVTVGSSYNDVSTVDTAHTETLNTYPYFIESSLYTVATSLPNESVFSIAQIGDEYGIHVPATPIADSRNMEYFYWRIAGVVGSTAPKEIGINLPPILSPDLPEYSDDLSEGQTYPVEYSGYKVNIGILNFGGGYPTSKLSALLDLELSAYNHLGIEFVNPIRSDHSLTAKAFPLYWTVPLADLSDTDKLNSFDVLIVPITRTDFPFVSALDEWSKLPGHGLIFAFDHLPYFNGVSTHLPTTNVKWGFTWDTSDQYVDMELAFLSDHDLCTGRRSAYELEYSPTLPATDNPWDEDDTIFDIAYPLRCKDYGKFYPLIGAYDYNSPASPANEEIVSGIFDNRIIVMDPFSVISVLGAPRINNGIISNPESVGGLPAFYGLRSTNPILEYNIRTTYRQDGLKFLYNCIVYLAFGKTMIFPSTGYVGGSLQPIPRAKEYIWSEIQTPYVRSWITTANSLSRSERAADSKLVVKNGKLMRKLLDFPTDTVIRSYAHSNYGIDFTMIGEVDSWIEVTNTDVKIYEDGDTAYAFTESYGGPPFEAGKAYPSEWVRSDSWVARKELESQDVIINIFDVATKVDRVSDTSPVYATHSASWFIKTLEPGVARDIYWEAIGTKSTSTYSEEKKIIDGSATFSVKSQEMETDRTTAYAWVFLPQCNLTTWRQGSSGDTVKFWQTALKSLGYYSGSLDGLYGPITAGGVLRFQGDHNEILEDGIIGPETGGRIAQDAADNGKPLPNHAQYVGSLNMLESRAGTYGRRSNPFGTVYAKYTATSLQDYIKVTFDTAQPIKRLEIKGYAGPSANTSFKVLKVAAKNAAGVKIAEVLPNVTISPGVVNKDISFPTEVANVKTLWIFVESTYIFDQHTAKAFYWGVEYIQAYGKSTSATVTTSPAKQTGKFSSMPGETNTIVLRSVSSYTGESISWPSGAVKLYKVLPTATVPQTVLTDATATSLNSPTNTQWEVEDTRTSPSITTCPSTATTLTKQSGTKFFNPKLAAGCTGEDVATLVASVDSHTTIGFHNGTSFVGTKTLVSNLVGTNHYHIAVRVNDLVTIGYKTVFHDEEEQFTEPDGSISITGEDPPIGFFAYKPYAVRQIDGRLNVKIVPPSNDLTSFDPWYPSITFGNFTRTVPISDSSVGWQSKYTSGSVDAHYIVPEQTWSQYGQYTVAHADETAIYNGPYAISTKYSPILFNEALDGWTDISVYINGTLQNDSEIEDISKDGDITLSNLVTSSDLIEVDYYTRDTCRPIPGLDLNPYPGHPLSVDGNDLLTYQKIGLPVYIYILPAYCTLNGIPMADSVETNVLNYTLNVETFDSGSDYYNPLAILIGVVSCVAKVTPKDLTLLDARKRGGGNDDATSGNYYDNNYFVDKSYPCNAVLVFEFDSSYKTSEEIIKEAISKNVAAGTLWKIRWTNA